MATLSQLSAWRPMNFGLRTLRLPVTIETLLAEVDAYDPLYATHVCAVIRSKANKDAWLNQVEAIYRDVIRDHCAPTADASALAAARYLERWSPRFDQSRTAVLESQEADDLNGQANFTQTRPELGLRMTADAATLDHHLRLMQGFGPREHWGAWSTSHAALAMIRLPACEGEHDLQLVAEVIPLLSPKMPSLTVDVTLNGRRITTWTFHSDDPHMMAPRALYCPASLIKGMGAAWLLLESHNPRTPIEAGINPHDGRLIGLGLIAPTWRKL